MRIPKLVKDYPVTAAAGTAAVVAVVLGSLWIWGRTSWPFPAILAFVIAAAVLTFGVAYIADRKIWQSRQPGLTPNPTGLTEETRSEDDGEREP